MKENASLVERLSNPLFAALNLNAQVKDLENEKSCLVTAIKLVQWSDKSLTQFLLRSVNSVNESSAYSLNESTQVCVSETIVLDSDDLLPVKS